MPPFTSLHVKKQRGEERQEVAPGASAAASAPQASTGRRKSSSHHEPKPNPTTQKKPNPRTIEKTTHPSAFSTICPFPPPPPIPHPLVETTTHPTCPYHSTNRTVVAVSGSAIMHILLTRRVCQGRWRDDDDVNADKPHSHRNRLIISQVRRQLRWEHNKRPLHT